MLNNLFIFLTALFVVIKGATLSTRYAARLADNFKFSKYVIGFIVISIISILPETFISINAAIQGVPSFGLGMLFGSNVADLTLVMAGIVFFTGRSLKVESRILKNNDIYPYIFLLPIFLGLNGNYSRFEGLALITTGAIFYYLSFKNGADENAIKSNDGGKLKNFLLLLLSMAMLLAGSYFTVNSAVNIAGEWGVSPVLVGMLVVGVGTTMPEFFFSLKSAKKDDDSLAIGDILGTVLADATIVVGILALISPFSFSKKIIYVTATFMMFAAFILLQFMKTGKTLSKKETYLLFSYWLIFVITEFLVNR